MCKAILQPKTRSCPHPRINILWGERAAEVFWEIRGVQSRSCLFDGRHAPKACMGESDALLVGFHSFLATQQDDRPLFLCDFLERLDESVDLHPIFDALIAKSLSGLRQNAMCNPVTKFILASQKNQNV